jgi:hypothetical protein
VLSSLVPSSSLLSLLSSLLLCSLSSSGLSAFPANSDGKENIRHESYTE